MRSLVFGWIATLIAVSGAWAQVIEQSVPNNPGSLYDPRRGVLSYNQGLRQASSFVVRVNVFSDGARSTVLQSIGTGIVIDVERGLVVTNAHLVDDHSSVSIETEGGEGVEAVVLGADPLTDLALLQAEMQGVSQARFADSDYVEVGDIVFAVGYPRGLAQSYTSGIISGVSRNGFRNNTVADIGVDDFLQTDAPINPGNSGGPLLDSAGRVIGVNSFIMTTDGASAGLHFAIPSRVVVPIIRQIREHGRVTRGVIGIRMQTLTPDRADGLGTNVSSGVVVTYVAPGSAAERAGIELGDVITSAGGRQIHNQRDFINFALLAIAGEPHTLFMRRGREVVQVQIIPSLTEPSSALRLGPPVESGVSVFGASLQDGDNGALIIRLEAGSVAQRQGLREGDVLAAFNGEAVNSAEELVAQVLRAGSGTHAIRVRRGDDVEFITFLTN